MLAKVVEQRGMGFIGRLAKRPGDGLRGTYDETARHITIRPAPIPSLNDAPSYTTLTETWTKDGASTQQAVTNYLLQTNQNRRKITITAPKRVERAFNIPTMPPINGMTGLSIRTKRGTETPATLYCRAAPLHGRKEVILLRDRLRLLRQTNFSRRRARISVTVTYYNQVTSERDYDFDGSMLREVRTQYQNDGYYSSIYNHIFNLPTIVETYKGDGVTRVARTDITYDQNAENLADTPDVNYHMDSYNPHAPSYWVEPYCEEYEYNTFECVKWGGGYCASGYVPSTAYRGLPTTVKSYANATSLDNNTAEIETRGYDITGNLIKSSKFCDPQTPCEHSMIAYTSATQYAYPQAVTRGSESDANKQVTVSTVYDYNTGMVYFRDRRQRARLEHELFYRLSPAADDHHAVSLRKRRLHDVFLRRCGTFGYRNSTRRRTISSPARM